MTQTDVHEKMVAPLVRGGQLFTGCRQENRGPLDDFEPEGPQMTMSQ